MDILKELHSSFPGHTFDITKEDLFDQPEDVTDEEWESIRQTKEILIVDGLKGNIKWASYDNAPFYNADMVVEAQKELLRILTDNVRKYLELK